MPTSNRKKSTPSHDNLDITLPVIRFFLSNSLTMVLNPYMMTLFPHNNYVMKCQTASKNSLILLSYQQPSCPFQLPQQVCSQLIHILINYIPLVF